MMARPSICVDTITPPAVSKTESPASSRAFSLFKAANKKEARWRWFNSATLNKQDRCPLPCPFSSAGTQHFAGSPDFEPRHSHVRSPPNSGHAAIAWACRFWAKVGSQSGVCIQARHMTPSLWFGPPSPPILHCWFRDNEKRLRRWSRKSSSRQAARTSQIFSACPLLDL